MRISLNWLRELVELTQPPEELAETLTMAGFEVEEIEDRRTWAEGVVVGRVVDRQPHPNADKLSVCTVDIGADAPSTIVCGAANVRADIFVPVATIGTYLPKIDLKIRPRKLRDVPSEGMICSLSELGLAKESEGIYIFEQSDLHPGADARPYLGLDDVVLDLTSTANRADALSMVGVAREVAALTGQTLKLPEVPDLAIDPHATGLSVNLAAQQACPVFIGTAIEGVKIAPSPAWLQRRLQAAGTRPINNVVDITNYVLLEWGQPLHAFDRDRLRQAGGSDDLAIGVRHASPGETLTTLDGQTRSLTDQTLLITANDRPVSLAGVMGGEMTEVHPDTQNLLLEAAWFDTVAIRRSARSQGMRTEASARYERGVNQAELGIACRRAIHLILSLAGGTVGAQAIADSRPTQSTRTIELRLDRVNQVLGPIDLGADLPAIPSTEADAIEETGELQAEDVERILTTLGCRLMPVEAGQVWNVTVPPYRYRDLEREIDLIEEVARLYGYNNFCDTLPAKTEYGYLSIEQALTRKIHQAFRAVGLTEAIHYSLVKTEGENQVVLANPLFTEYSALRTELISGLIDAFQYNLEQNNGALNAFEIGRVFWREEEGLSEADRVAGIIGGDSTQGRWVRSGREQPLTWFEAKGMLESAFERLGLDVEYQPDRLDARLHPGRTASLWIRGERLGTFGQLHPQLRQSRGLPDAIYVFELDLDVLLDALDRDDLITPQFQPYSPYPASDRDLAFFVPTQVSVAELERVMRKAGGNLLDRVELFDEYRGANVPEGKRSLAFRLTYRASDRTLTDTDVEPVQQKVREALEEKFQVELRS
ncbi:phenylalanine--tRNA ligase subunit beta [Microcoleus sp. FACHB-1515]|uniref:phenylalanine--tRNA ligase subunit beta n=1 Tax=Cyanophyceae TaxID=3028117 RepID=UPI00168428DF|nr:phenylalanine--tRNA ligase subunit beta [Microcoleus sp. FACHB-1515]MBD2090555.1 phenylalanine--tRNA ligase subunit beta [Microcoleus sp. FACHB-1515]